MSATLLVSPTPVKLFTGQAFQLRCQVRDSEVRVPYDLTGAGQVNVKLVSLTGGTPRTTTNAGVYESNPNAIFTLLIAAADTTALTAGRWYLQVQIVNVPTSGGQALNVDLYPFDVLVAQ